MEIDPFKIEPTDKQSSFMTHTQRYGCMSGGYGSGKTYAGCLRSLILSQYPKNVGLIGRLTYRELNDTTRKTFFELCPPEYYDEKQGGRWSPTENNLRLVNGSEILFRHLDTVSEAELKSLNLGWFFIDQAEEIGLPVWRVLQSRLRLNRVPNRFGFISCNPEPGSWIEDIFKKPFDENTLDSDHFYMDTTTYDNPYNPPDYIESLLRTFPDELKKRYVEGRWDVLQNQIYTEFDPKVHVITPFQIPKSWEHIVALDHGMVNPAGVVFGAIDYDHNIYIYDEYYSPGMVSEHSRAIKAKIEDQEISMWLIDPSTSAKTREKEGKQWSVLEEYEDNGLYFTPANNQLLAGINRVKEFLKINPLRMNPSTRKKGAPRLYIFKNCVNLVWEMKQYKWRKLRSLTTRNVPEQPIDYADHLLDALRYLIMSRFPAPTLHEGGRMLVTRAERANANILAVPEGDNRDDMFNSSTEEVEDIINNS